MPAYVLNVLGCGLHVNAHDRAVNEDCAEQRLQVITVPAFVEMYLKKTIFMFGVTCRF